MDYNELKLAVLRHLRAHGPSDSSEILRLLTGQMPVEVHAVRMALVRYYRMGLLKRERSGGVFIYSLTPRGERRLNWLEQKAAKES